MQRRKGPTGPRTTRPQDLSSVASRPRIRAHHSHSSHSSHSAFDQNGPAKHKNTEITTFPAGFQVSGFGLSALPFAVPQVRALKMNPPIQQPNPVGRVPSRGAPSINPVPPSIFHPLAHAPSAPPRSPHFYETNPKPMGQTPIKSMCFRRQPVCSFAKRTQKPRAPHHALRITHHAAPLPLIQPLEKSRRLMVKSAQFLKTFIAHG